MIPVPLAVPEKRWVLLVEDDLMVRLLVAECLREAGLHVAEARSADEALSYLGGGGKMNLLFTDIEMPGAIDGLQFAQRLRESDPDLPVVIASGGGRPPKGVPGVFVPKPYDLARLVALVTGLLQGGQAT